MMECESHGNVILCREPMEEVVRRPDGVRWCFVCRKRVEFDYVVMAPTGISYYGPSPSFRCQPHGHFDGDVGFGREREWEES